MTLKMAINYNSFRSEKARIATKFNKYVLLILPALVAMLFCSGIAFVVIGLSVGWSLIGLSVVPAMIIEWYRGELHHLKNNQKQLSIDDILSADILGRLPKDATPSQIASVVARVTGGNFFAVRFGIGAKFLQEISSNNKSDTDAVWQEAYNLYAQTNSKNISAAIIIVALIKCSFNYESLLSHLQLDINDLINGIHWYNHLINLVDQHSVRRLTGGLARDWSFGWTPLLGRFGQNISQQLNGRSTALIKLSAHEDSLNQLINILGKNGRQNAALVGLPGVGKTEIIHAFASKIIDSSEDIPESLKFRQVYMLDASTLISAAVKYDGIEKLITQILLEAYNAKNIIICLDNAQLFFENGVGSVDISNILCPILEAGNLRMILIMDEQKYLQISKRTPELANSLNKIFVSPADFNETIAVIQDKSLVFESQNDVVYMYQSFVEAYRLGDRYIYDLAMPGKAINLLESAAHYSEDGVVTAESVRQAIEKTLDIKVSVATNVEDREKLLNLEDLLHKRMISQTRAVKVVSDALRRARAGVRNQNRPIGTFLFLGPTGVGKTELAKALADVYFDGEDRIIRLDMNEYVKSGDVLRLIADGADNSNSLTARVMKHPFSVVLLDEIEKAHPSVLSTLLQLLDEGILRDIKNREVSFRDSIIIATSNAGADKIREYIDRGYDIDKFENQFIDGLIESKQFSPEFLNRFDEIVMFKPLTKDELLKVVDLMIADVNKTLSLQKVSVKVSEEAKIYLVESGYDPRLGARPMRRIVQRAVENTVAKRMLSGEILPGDVIEIELDQIKL